MKNVIAVVETVFEFFIRSTERVLLVFTSIGLIAVIVAKRDNDTTQLDENTSITTRIPDTTMTVVLISERVQRVADYVKHESRREAVKRKGGLPTSPAAQLPRDEQNHIITHGVKDEELQGAFWNEHGETAYRHASNIAAFWSGVFNVPEAWIWQTWWIESKFDHTAVNKGSGCAGLQQLSKSTADWIGISHQSVTKNIYSSIESSGIWYRKLYQLWVNAGEPKFNSFGEFYGTQFAPSNLAKFVNRGEDATVCNCGKSNRFFYYDRPNGEIKVRDINRAMLEKSSLSYYRRK
jgi:hypothetical protein